MKAAIATLGCKVNQAESAAIEGALVASGYQIVSFHDQADLYIVNTCSVTSKSDYQSRQLIRRVNQKGGRVVVTGCYAELNPDEIKALGNVALVVKQSEKLLIVEYLNDLARTKPRNESKPPYHYNSSRTRAFLKVQDGCNAFCAYCIVPLARGKSRSLPFDEALCAANSLAKSGYEEIVFTGIHVGRYGVDLTPKTSLYELVNRASLENPSIGIRLSSIEADELNPAFIELIKQKRLSPHLHFPLQSGSDELLKAMNRKASVSDFSELVMTVYQAIPEVAIGVDVIAGLPGESEKDFQKTYETLQSLPISYMHVFPYSSRPHTEASKMGNQIPGPIKKQRAMLLRSLGEQKREIFITSMIGKTLDVIIEGVHPNGRDLKGMTENYLKALILNHPAPTRKRVKATIVGQSQGVAICQIV
jgi:threonylcarbamoyladenosine tRNA methylthiotransferase MtaB